MTAASKASVPTPPARPWWVRAIAHGLQAAHQLGAFRFDPELLWSRAMQTEGLEDYGPDAEHLREGLEVFVESAQRDARVHGIGLLYLHNRFFSLILRSRLRIAPSIRAGKRPRRPPLIVSGLPRSGTTFLHRLLELADDAAGIPFWQLNDPLPSPHRPDDRLERARTSIKRLQAAVPVSIDAQHFVRAELSDECGYLLRNAWTGLIPWTLPAYGWQRWSMEQDSEAAYRMWAAYLHHLEPARARLVLKDPMHLAHIGPLERAVPGSMIVQTHRDPLEVVPSFHKLMFTLHAVLASELDIPRTVEVNTAWLLWALQRNQEMRAAHAGPPIVDVMYTELIADPIAVVERIHDAFSLPLSGRAVDRMRAWLQANGQRKHGPNPYSLEAFGQSKAEIRERYAAYRERYGMLG